ncbi:MAG: hypothetical protein HQL23_08805 [Candidatus Omnitrophica bacterium]|nr:hypothetical protein [Candidatus Omnitrophota bacterium]
MSRSAMRLVGNWAYFIKVREELADKVMPAKLRAARIYEANKSGMSLMRFKDAYLVLASALQALHPGADDGKEIAPTGTTLDVPQPTLARQVKYKLGAEGRIESIWVDLAKGLDQVTDKVKVINLPLEEAWANMMPADFSLPTVAQQLVFSLAVAGYRVDHSTNFIYVTAASPVAPGDTVRQFLDRYKYFGLTYKGFVNTGYEYEMSAETAQKDLNEFSWQLAVLLLAGKGQVRTWVRSPRGPGRSLLKDEGLSHFDVEQAIKALHTEDNICILIPLSILNENSRPSEEAASPVLNPGGLALNGNKMGMDVIKEGKGIEFKFNPAIGAQLRSGNFTGLQGIILQIIPIQSVLPILGMNEEESPADVKKFAKV